MAPAPGHLGDAVKMLVQVWLFPEEMAMVDAFAAALSQQSYGAAFSRAEALRMAAMEGSVTDRLLRVPVPAPLCMQNVNRGEVAPWVSDGHREGQSKA